VLVSTQAAAARSRTTGRRKTAGKPPALGPKAPRLVGLAKLHCPPRDDREWDRHYRCLVRELLKHYATVTPMDEANLYTLALCFMQRAILVRQMISVPRPPQLPGTDKEELERRRQRRKEAACLQDALEWLTLETPMSAKHAASARQLLVKALQGSSLRYSNLKKKDMSEPQWGAYQDDKHFFAPYMSVKKQLLDANWVAAVVSGSVRPSRRQRQALSAVLEREIRRRHLYDRLAVHAVRRLGEQIDESIAEAARNPARQGQHQRNVSALQREIDKLTRALEPCRRPAVPRSKR